MPLSSLHFNKLASQSRNDFHSIRQFFYFFCMVIDWLLCGQDLSKKCRGNLITSSLLYRFKFALVGPTVDLCCVVDLIWYFHIDWNKPPNLVYHWKLYLFESCGTGSGWTFHWNVLGGWSTEQKTRVSRNMVRNFRNLQHFG